MRLHKDYVVHDSGEEVVLVATGESAEQFCGMLKGNQTFGVILDYLKTDVTEDSIVDGICEAYQIAREVVEQDVKEVISKLKEVGALSHG